MQVKCCGSCEYLYIDDKDMGRCRLSKDKNKKVKIFDKSCCDYEEFTSAHSYIIEEYFSHRR